MAKTRVIKKSSSIKKVSIDKYKKKFNLKDCVIKLHRINPLTYDNDNRSYTYFISVIARNGRVKFNNVEAEKTSNGCFNIGIKIHNNELIINEPTNSSLKPTNSSLETINSSLKPTQKLIAKTLNQLIKDEWNQCKKIKKGEINELHEGDYVMAKMRTFAPWPAKITSFTKNKKSATVYFYGSHNSGSVLTEEIVRFSSSQTLIRLLLIRNPNDFKKGVVEVELENHIPPELSITNVNQQISA